MKPKRLTTNWLGVITAFLCALTVCYAQIQPVPAPPPIENGSARLEIERIETTYVKRWVEQTGGLTLDFWTSEQIDYDWTHDLSSLQFPKDTVFGSVMVRGLGERKFYDIFSKDMSKWEHGKTEKGNTKVRRFELKTVEQINIIYKILEKPPRERINE